MFSPLPTIPKGVVTPLLVQTNIDVEESDLALWVKNGDWRRIESDFTKLAAMLFVCELQFKEEGIYAIKLTHKGQEIERGALRVSDVHIQTLLDAQLGNWEIKENRMHFYRLDGTSLASFDLFDKFGNPAEFGVVRRVRCS